MVRRLLKPLAIGIGHAFRRDDGVGPTVARLLAERGIRALAHHGEGTDLMVRWSGYDPVVVVDAMSAPGLKAGTIRVWDAAAAPLPTDCFVMGSHQFGLVEAVEMARLLNRLPPRLWVVGIAGDDMDAGLELTPSVARSLDEVCRRVTVLLEGGDPVGC